MPEMVVPKSSHDRFCSKQSFPNARSTITVSESAYVISSDGGLASRPDGQKRTSPPSTGFQVFSPFAPYLSSQSADSEIVMVDLAFGDDFFEQNRSWDDFGTTISGI